MILLPTEFAEGQSEFTCSKCGRTETRTIAKLPGVCVDESGLGTWDSFTAIEDPRNDMGKFVWFT